MRTLSPLFSFATSTACTAVQPTHVKPDASAMETFFGTRLSSETGETRYDCIAPLYFSIAGISRAPRTLSPTLNCPEPASEVDGSGGPRATMVPANSISGIHSCLVGCG